MLLSMFVGLGFYTNAQPTLTPKLAKQTYAWNTGNHSRDMALYNGVIYAIDKNNKQVHKINSTTGVEITPALADNNFTGYSLTFDNAGNSYVTSGAYGMTTNLQGTLTVNNSGTYANTASTTGGRIDFVEAFGDFSTTGYLAGATVNTADKINVWKVVNGAIQSAGTPFSFAVRGSVVTGSDITFVDANHLIVTGKLIKPMYVTFNMDAGTSSKVDLGSATTPVGGSTYFTLYDVPYVVVATSGLGKFKIFDISIPSTPVEVGEQSVDLGSTANGTDHIGFEAVKTADNKATIYVWVPNNGLASYEFEVEEQLEPISKKTFTVTVPAGTENVYVVGSFTGKEWDIANPYQLVATGNPNEFSGEFECDETIEYKYLNGKTDWDYAEAKLDGGDLVIWEGKPASADNRTYNASDNVKYWVASPKVKLNVSFDGSNTPANLFVKGDWDSWAAGKALTKSGDTYSLTVNEKTFANTEYKYYSNDPSADNWETIGSNRWAIYPTMNDEITGFVTEIPAVEPTGLILKFKKTDYTWNASDAARSAVLANGVINVIDKTSKKIQKLSTADGSLSGDQQNNNYLGAGIAADNNGNLFVHSTFAATNGNFGGSLVMSGTPTHYTVGSNLISPNINRTDFFGGTGNFATKGYLAAAGTALDVIAVWEIENGAFKDISNPIQILGKRVEGGEFAASGDVDWVSANQILITSQGKKAQIMTLDLVTPANSSSTAIGSVSTTAGGGKYFKIGSTPFVALAKDRFGVIEIYDITNIATPNLVATSEAVGATANAAVHVSIMATVSGNTATLYVWAPNNGLAKYEYIHISTDKEENNIDSSQTFSITNTATGISIPLNTASVVELYTVNGLLLDRVNTSSTYTRDLDNGIYIVRVNGKAQKFVK